MCGLALATRAWGATPVTARFPVEDHFVDDGASAACGFPVTVDVTGTRTFELFFDQAGNPVPGAQQPHRDHERERHQPPGGRPQHGGLRSGERTGTDLGLVFREFLPGVGIVIMDRGRVSFASDGSLLFEAGPHPALDGDFSALCAALTPQ